VRSHADAPVLTSNHIIDRLTWTGLTSHRSEHVLLRPGFPEQGLQRGQKALKAECRGRSGSPETPVDRRMAALRNRPGGSSAAAQGMHAGVEISRCVSHGRPAIAILTRNRFLDSAGYSFFTAAFSAQFRPECGTDLHSQFLQCRPTGVPAAGRGIDAGVAPDGANGGYIVIPPHRYGATRAEIAVHSGSV
jgi:hypothetical protein